MQGSADLIRPRGADAPISTRASRCASCWTGARCRWSTRTTPPPPTRSPSATTTSLRSVALLLGARLWCCSPTCPACTRDPRLDAGARLVERVEDFADLARYEIGERIPPSAPAGCAARWPPPGWRRAARIGVRDGPPGTLLAATAVRRPAPCSPRTPSARRRSALASLREARRNRVLVDAGRRGYCESGARACCRSGSSASRGGSPPATRSRSSRTARSSARGSATTRPRSWTGSRDEVGARLELFGGLGGGAPRPLRTRVSAGLRGWLRAGPQGRRLQLPGSAEAMAIATTSVTAACQSAKRASRALAGADDAARSCSGAARGAARRAQRRGAGGETRPTFRRTRGGPHRGASRSADLTEERIAAMAEGVRDRRPVGRSARSSIGEGSTMASTCASAGAAGRSLGDLRVAERDRGLRRAR